MNTELAYALITPYSLYKSRTGGIIGRMLAHPTLELVASRMFVFSEKFLDEYTQIMCHDQTDEQMKEAWHKYIRESFSPNNPWGRLPRAMFLLLKGENAVRTLKEDVIGSFTKKPIGDTIRGTYGDFILYPDGSMRYFEPAVITCPRPEINDEHLKLIAKYSVTDGGLLDGRINYGRENVECSLVMLKPDNFYRPSRRPGNIIDTFAKTGLKIVASKLFNMTVAMGEEFYGPLKQEFVEKLQFLVKNKAVEKLKGAFDFEFTEADGEMLAKHLARRNAACEFNKIVEYMTGVDPETIDESQKVTACKTKCMAMLYEGPDAVAKIRAALGATNPGKAEPGTVRSDYGHDLMRNGAHASDSSQNALRERKIVGLATQETQTCDVKEVIDNYLASK